MEGSENHEPPRLCIEVNVPRGEWKLAVLRLHRGATLQSAVEVTVDLHCKTMCFNQLFGDVNIFSVVLSIFLLQWTFLWSSLRRMSSPSSSEEPPLVLGILYCLADCTPTILCVWPHALLDKEEQGKLLTQPVIDATVWSTALVKEGCPRPQPHLHGLLVCSIWHCAVLDLFNNTWIEKQWVGPSTSCELTHLAEEWIGVSSTQLMPLNSPFGRTNPVI